MHIYLLAIKVLEKHAEESPNFIWDFKVLLYVELYQVQSEENQNDILHSRISLLLLYWSEIPNNYIHTWLQKKDSSSMKAFHNSSLKRVILLMKLVIKANFLVSFNQ